MVSPRVSGLPCGRLAGSTGAAGATGAPLRVVVAGRAPRADGAVWAGAHVRAQAQTRRQERVNERGEKCMVVRIESAFRRGGEISTANPGGVSHLFFQDHSFLGLPILHQHLRGANVHHLEITLTHGEMIPHPGLPSGSGGGIPQHAETVR